MLPEIINGGLQSVITILEFNAIIGKDSGIAVMARPPLAVDDCHIVKFGYEVNEVLFFGMRGVKIPVQQL